MRMFMSLFGTFAFMFGPGCTTQVNYTINPDGTAKVSFVHTERDANYRTAQNVETNIRRNRKHFTGWRDVTYKREADGSATTQGTIIAGNINEFHVNMIVGAKPYLTDNKDGTKTLLIKHSSQYDYRPRKPLTEDKIKAMIAKVKSDYIRQLREPDATARRKSTFTLTIDPPGKVRSLVNMKQLADGKLTVGYNQGDVLDALGEILKDERNIREFVVAGESLIKRGNVLTYMVNERLFGTRAPVQAILEGPFEQKFDYKTEAATSESDASKVVASSGIIPHVLPKPGSEANLKNIQAVKATLTKGKTNYIRLAFKGTLPEVGRYQNDAEIYSVTDGDGNVLLPNLESSRRGYVKLVDDGKAAEVSLTIKAGEFAPKSIKQITGVIRYRAMGQLIPESLGKVTTRSGSKLNKYNFNLTDCGISRGTLVFKWTTKAPPLLARVVFKDGAKEFLSQDIEPEAKERDIDRPWADYRFKGTLPRSLEVVFYTASKLEIIEVPFVLENVSLSTD